MEIMATLKYNKNYINVQFSQQNTICFIFTSRISATINQQMIQDSLFILMISIITQQLKQ